MYCTVSCSSHLTFVLLNKFKKPIFFCYSLQGLNFELVIFEARQYPPLAYFFAFRIAIYYYYYYYYIYIYFLFLWKIFSQTLFKSLQGNTRMPGRCLHGKCHLFLGYSTLTNLALQLVQEFFHNIYKSLGSLFSWQLGGGGESHQEIFRLPMKVFGSPLSPPFFPQPKKNIINLG